MDIKLEKPRREPSVGDVYLYDAKYYMIIMDRGDYYCCLDLEIMKFKYDSQWIDYLVPVRDGEYIGTLKMSI